MLALCMFMQNIVAKATLTYKMYENNSSYACVDCMELDDSCDSMRMD